MRTRIKNQLQHLALNQGFRKKRALWRPEGRQWLEQLPLSEWAARRRKDCFHLLDELDQVIPDLTQAVVKAVENHPQARLLNSHPGVGPMTALGFALILGPVERFECSRQVASYLGLIPVEDSSSERRRLGHLSKQGNSLLCYLLVEAGQGVARWDPEFQRIYRRINHRKQHKGIAKVAIARKLAIRLYWMLKTNQPYSSTRTQGSSASPRVAVEAERVIERPAS